MKNQYNFVFSLSFACFMLSAAFAQAAVLTVNNANPSPGQYTTVQAAIDAAGANDIILVHGTGINYGNFTITKSNLTFYGAGHEPQSAGAFETYCEIIYFASGSIHDVKIAGFNLYRVEAWGYSTYGDMNTDNITIEFCQIRYDVFIGQNNDPYYGTGFENWTIKNNYFSYPYSNFLCYKVSGVNFSFNICNGYLAFGGGTTNSNTGVAIYNNIFTAQYYEPIRELSVAVINNNIFYTPNAVAYNVQNCAWAKNLTDPNGGDNVVPPADGTFGNCNGNTGAGNNLEATDPMFTSTAGSTTWLSYQNNYRLQAASAGHNYGTDGTDIGVYGSGNTFSETGEPTIPVTNTLTIGNSTAPAGGTLNVNFTARNPVKDVN